MSANISYPVHDQSYRSVFPNLHNIAKQGGEQMEVHSYMYACFHGLVLNRPQLSSGLRVPAIGFSFTLMSTTISAFYKSRKISKSSYPVWDL